MLHFLGVVGFEGRELQPAVIAAAGQRLGGIGFDAPTQWRGSGCQVISRRRRLRDTDSAAVDPVVTRDGALMLIGSGRIDHREALIAALGLESQRIWTDAALMMAGFEQWGEAVADRLRGDFSFAVWDRENRRLILARDCFGTVPLFYHQGDGFVAFATNPTALLELGVVPRDLNPAMLGEYLTGFSVDATASAYRAIRRVPRAAHMIFEPTGTKTTTYWRPHRSEPLRLADDQAYVEATRAVLADILCGHLRNTLPIGVMLSGGLDSGALAATLALLAPEREIHTFTTVQRDGGREWDYVQRLAQRHPNIRVQAVAEKPATPIDDSCRDLFADLGLPLPAFGLFSRRSALAQAAQRSGVATLLNGDGGNRTLTPEGDEIFHHLFWTGRWLTLLREIWGTAGYLNRPLWQVVRRDFLPDVVPRRALRAWRRWRGDKSFEICEGSFLRRDFAIATGLQDKWADAPHNRDRLSEAYGRDWDMICLASPSSVADCYTLYYNRLGMECLAPLRDRRMVDFILSMPPEQLRRNGVTRFLARRVLADRLPAETLAKTDYFEPFADVNEWMESWWERARQRLADQHPADLAAAAIDLPQLNACFAGGIENIGRERLKWNAIRTLHVNEFIRWHQRMNQ